MKRISQDHIIVGRIPLQAETTGIKKKCEDFYIVVRTIETGLATKAIPHFYLESTVESGQTFAININEAKYYEKENERVLSWYNRARLDYCMRCKFTNQANNKNITRWEMVCIFWNMLNSGLYIYEAYGNTEDGSRKQPDYSKLPDIMEKDIEYQYTISDILSDKETAQEDYFSFRYKPVDRFASGFSTRLQNFVDNRKSSDWRYDDMPVKTVTCPVCGFVESIEDAYMYDKEVCPVCFSKKSKFVSAVKLDVDRCYTLEEAYLRRNEDYEPESNGSLKVRVVRYRKPT